MVTPVKDFFKKSCILSFVVFSSKWSACLDHIDCRIQRISVREVVSLIFHSQAVNICMTQKFRQRSHNLSKDRLISYRDMKQIAMIIWGSTFSSDWSICQELIHHSPDSRKIYFLCIRRKQDSEFYTLVKNKDLFVWKTIVLINVCFFLIIRLALNGIWSLNLIILDFFCWKINLWRT
jgi:hypothetical protein